MANVGKKDGGQGQQGQQGQGGQQGQQPQGGQQGQGQQGQQLARREPPQQLVGRDPFQMLMRDPIQMMREMMIDPFRMLSQFPSAFLGGREMVWSPQFEIRERDDAFVFKADMPGLRAEDLDISLSGNQLQISGKREQEREEGEGQYVTYERSYGSFVRSFVLPESADVDNIRSDLKNGELTLVVPKKAGSQQQRRKIQIGSGSKS